MTTMLEQLLMELNQQVGGANPMAPAYRNKHTAVSPSGQGIYGPGGMFGVSGLERDIITSRMQPMGLASRLEVRPSIKTNPLFGYITGFKAATGVQSTEPCADGPCAGAMKTCLQTAQFGKYCFCTRPFDIVRSGEVTDRGEFLDLRILNDPLVEDLGGIFGGLNTGDALESAGEVLQRLLEVGVAFQDELSRQLYRGTGMANEFPGLDILIGETKVDAQTGADCPSLASDIRDFAYEVITTPSGGNAIVSQVVNMWRNLNNNASQMNFGATRWVIVMRKILFHELTDVWPCNYMSFRCIPEVSNVEVSVSADEQVRMRDAMRTGSYLMIDGERVEVVTDDAVVQEDIGGGVYASDIYFIPLTVRGGFAVTYWETFDFSRGTVEDIRLGRLTTDFWTDQGRYLWHKKPPQNGCVQWNSCIRPRILLLTPHLAGRILNVAYSPEKLYREPFPGDYNFINGGQTQRPAPSYFSDWNPPGD